MSSQDCGLLGEWTRVPATTSQDGGPQRRVRGIERPASAWGVGGGKSRSHAEGHSAEASSFTDMAGWLWNMLETGPPSGLSIAVSGGAQ